MLVSSTTSLTMKMSREREREVCFDFCWWGFWCSMLVESESKKKYRYPDSQYQSSLEKSSYICVVLLYCTTTYTIFSSLNKESSLKGFSEEKLKRSCTTYYSHLCYYYTPQLTFFITQTQDGLWNIVHLCFFIFHMMMSKRVLHTYTGQARSKKKRKNSY